MIAAGKKKAFQRRGEETETLGTRNPKTPEEIKESILAGQRRARKRKSKVTVEKVKSLRNAEALRNAGYRIDYDMLLDRIQSAAYKYDPETQMVTAYFTTRSQKDPFSKAGAREALVKHMNNDTHKLVFRAVQPKREWISLGFKRSIKKRLESHPHEFPSRVVKSYSKLKETPEGKLVEALEKYIDNILDE
jgi:hypothetical protein